MRLACIVLLTAACGGQASLPPAAPATPSPSPSRHQSALAPAYESALAGDMRAALARLGAVPTAALDAKEASQRDCMAQRFTAASPPPAGLTDPFLSAVVARYRDYWSQVLLGRASRDDGEARLVERLRATLNSAPADDVFDALGTALTERGYYSIRGVTSPYQDLMVWTNETRTTYDVRIPDGKRRVEVVLMSGFLSLGWEGFATCERHFPGGWAEKDRLYCMADSYDRSSEEFSVSYLAHETQHFADYERFPKLEGPELEYRAKLVELIESQKTTRALLSRFAAQTGESRDSPHNYANRRVVLDIQQALSPATWQSVSEARIREAARTLFDRNTELLVSRGAATVSSVL